MLLCRLAAAAVALLHLAFVLFVAFGGLWVWRWPRLAGLHLPAVAWGASIEFAGWMCPLTSLELHLHQAIGQAGYAGGFVDHDLRALLYPAGLTREGPWALGAGVLAANGAVYGVRLGRRTGAGGDERRAGRGPVRRGAGGKKLR